MRRTMYVLLLSLCLVNQAHGQADFSSSSIITGEIISADPGLEISLGIMNLEDSFSFGIASSTVQTSDENFSLLNTGELFEVSSGANGNAFSGNSDAFGVTDGLLSFFNATNQTLNATVAFDISLSTDSSAIGFLDNGSAFADFLIDVNGTTFDANDIESLSFLNNGAVNFNDSFEIDLIVAPSGFSDVGLQVGSLGVAIGTATIPEPSSLVVIAMTLCALATKRRR